MKKCTKCKEIKELHFFSIKKSTKDGLLRECKSCESKRLKDYYKRNSKKIKEYQKKYREDNPEKLKAKNYQKNNSENKKEYLKEYYLRNKAKAKIKNKEYRNKNPDKIKNYQKEYRKNNSEKALNCHKNRKKKDPLYKLSGALRTRINQAFKHKFWKKNGPTEKLLGESFEFVHNYIEIQFKKEMCWQNHGEWHIDHKIPLAYAKTEEELIKLFHYTNLQPLWAIDNLTKNNKIVEHQIKLL